MSAAQEEPTLPPWMQLYVEQEAAAAADALPSGADVPMSTDGAAATSIAGETQTGGAGSEAVAEATGVPPATEEEDGGGDRHDKGSGAAAANNVDGSVTAFDLSALLDATATTELIVPAAPSDTPSATARPLLSATGAGVLALDAATGTTLGLPVMTAVVLVYRVSSGGYAHKVKPSYITKEGCLLNWLGVVRAFLLAMPHVRARIVLVADAATDALASFAGGTAQALADAVNATREDDCRVVLDMYRTAYGDGAGSYTHTMAVLASLSPQLFPRATTAVYTCEDDYLHTRGALSTLLQGLALAPYATGYAHPDRFLPAGAGGNLLVSRGGEVTRLLFAAQRYWVTTNSTTMTYATTLQVLEQDAREHAYFTRSAPPRDFHMWLALGVRGRVLVHPLPAVSTHGETAWLSPCVDWDAIGTRAAKRAATLAASGKYT